MRSSIHDKSATHHDIAVQQAHEVTAHGGLVLIDTLLRESGTLDFLRSKSPVLEHRSDTSRGFTPVALISQTLLGLCSGCINLADLGRLKTDEALGKLIGLPKMADADTIRKMLEAQGQAGVDAIWEASRRLVAHVSQSKPNLCQSAFHEGKVSVFFDDTQIEVDGRQFESAAINYDGKTTLSWQTLWVGGFLAAGKMDEGSADVSKHLGPLLMDAKPLWEPLAKENKAHFYADSGSSAGKYINKVDQRGWSWTISYNKWTKVLEPMARAEPDAQWSAAQPRVGRNGEAQIEQFCWLRHQPGDDCERGQDFACVRYRAADGSELFWRYAFVVGGPGATLQPGASAWEPSAWQLPATPQADPKAAAAHFAKHHFKGAMEQGFSNVLGDLDLRHPPCRRLLSNEMWYALAALAHNLLRALQVLRLGPEQQALRIRQIIRWVVTVPVKLTRHAHRSQARFFVAKASLAWWRLALDWVWPRRKRGRPGRPAQPKPAKPASGRKAA